MSVIPFRIGNMVSTQNLILLSFKYFYVSISDDDVAVFIKIEDKLTANVIETFCCFLSFFNPQTYHKYCRPRFGICLGGYVYICLTNSKSSTWSVMWTAFVVIYMKQRKVLLFPLSVGYFKFILELTNIFDIKYDK